ncbi:cationic amino acid transporter 3-like [Planococcus citri]|uniref:cationic amino acid transporter 3-like n=1 Tax=Planococcus citri TaxID=170843 RepID=UPI0031F82624
MMTETSISAPGRSHGWSNPLTRRKTNSDGESGERLARVLGLLDLTSLGIGSTLGLGVYVLAGKVALSDAGPAVTISFLIAAIASAFAGLCYAELASRVPKAGSAYVYCYVTIGEFAAFVIGWNLILEYAIGTAAVAKAYSDYVDFAIGGAINSTLTSLFPIHVSFLAPFPDFFAFSLVMLLTVLLAWGVKESSSVNNFFTLINILTVLTVIIAGAFKVNTSYWSIPKETLEANGVTTGGEGGFLPFGWKGVFKGAATCFFGYVGFDVIATTGEEAKNPKRNIPLALIISLVIIFFAYFGVATVLTMLVPYYSQDPQAPLTFAFLKADLPLIKNIISVGTFCALSASLLGAIFPLPRILYAMADDGLLFKCFSDVNKSTKTPLKATLISGILTGIFAALFNLQQLMDMMSIGTLLAYSIVALCILILRYKEEEDVYKPPNSMCENTSPELRSLVKTLWHTYKISFNLNGIKRPTSCSQKMTLWSILFFTIFIMCLCYMTVNDDYFLDTSSILFYALIVAFAVLCIVCYVIISRQPQSDSPVAFKVPLVPLVPICSITMNMYLMMNLDMSTWVRFIIWLIIGFVIYIFYSIKHSVEGRTHNAIQGENQIYSNQTGQIADMTQM